MNHMVCYLVAAIEDIFNFNDTFDSLMTRFLKMAHLKYIKAEFY